MNEHRTAFTEAQLAEIGGHFKAIMAIVLSNMTPHTAAERRGMTIIGEKTIGDMEKVKEYIELYPHLLEAWLKKEDFLTDFLDLHNMLAALKQSDEAREALYDIYYTAGSEAYHWMLDFYHSVKQAALRDVPNAKLVAEDLGKRFHRPRRKKNDAAK